MMQPRRASIESTSLTFSVSPCSLCLVFNLLIYSKNLTLSSLTYSQWMPTSPPPLFDTVSSPVPLPNLLVAITIHALELYRTAYLRCPYLAVQRFVKTPCDLHCVSACSIVFS